MNARQKKAPDTANTRGAKFNDLKANYKSGRANIPPTSGEVLTNFRQNIIENIGHAPAIIEANGKLVRFSSNGKKDDLSGWYILHQHGDYAAGVFGCWRGGIKQTWHSRNGSQRLSDSEWQQLRKAIAEAKRQATLEQQVKMEKSHHLAVNLWNASAPADPSHPYLLRKRVGAYGIRQRGNLLLVPLCDLDGLLHGIQTIDPSGKKHFPKGTPKRGHFCLIGDSLTHPRGVYLCEGYATGASLHEAYGLPVLSCFDAGNLSPVAQAYRARFPHVPLTVCADNDRDPTSTGYGVGLAKAREICATLPGVGLIVPEFPAGTPLNFSDFNDLVSLLGSSEK